MSIKYFFKTNHLYSHYQKIFIRNVLVYLEPPFGPKTGEFLEFQLYLLLKMLLFLVTCYTQYRKQIQLILIGKYPKRFQNFIKAVHIKCIILKRIMVLNLSGKADYGQNSCFPILHIHITAMSFMRNMWKLDKKKHMKTRSDHQNRKERLT